MSNSTFTWQEKGTSWCGVAIYHMTATTVGRAHTLGELVGGLEQPAVEMTPLGEAVLGCVQQLSSRYPIRILATCIMPDHVHVVLHVTAPMERSIRYALRGWMQGCNKAARNMGLPSPVFDERPFLRVLTHEGQLENMIAYVKDNPRRLALARHNRGYFAVQQGVRIAGYTFASVGNIKLLYEQNMQPVHVHKEWVWDAERKGMDKPLRDYKNSCVLASRAGAVLISPFINTHEAAVRDVALAEKKPVIYILDNGFPDTERFKPAGELFDACADGRLLLLSPWPYNPERKRGEVLRQECVTMNKMAEAIAASRRQAGSDTIA